jgi:hypothetical protein
MGHFHIWWKTNKESYKISKETQIKIKKQNTKHEKKRLVPNEMCGLPTKTHKANRPNILY